MGSSVISDNNDDVIQQISKLPKLDKVDDLKRAVCVLADHADELESEKIELLDTLKREREMFRKEIET